MPKDDPKDKEPAAAAVPAPAPAPAPTTTESMLAAVLAKLTDVLPNLGLQPGLLREILVESQTAAAQATHKILRPENVEHPHQSVFSYPEGDIARPKPKLSRETFFCGVREDEDRLTPAEIEAYNAITEPRECRGGAWRAEILRSRSVGGKDQLLVYVPAATVDQRMVLPHQLTLVLHELNGGMNTSDVQALLSQIESLKAELAAQKAGTALTSVASGPAKSAAELESQLLGAGV